MTAKTEVPGDVSIDDLGHPNMDEAASDESLVKTTHSDPGSTVTPMDSDSDTHIEHGSEERGRRDTAGSEDFDDNDAGNEKGIVVIPEYSDEDEDDNDDEDEDDFDPDEKLDVFKVKKGYVPSPDNYSDDSYSEDSDDSDDSSIGSKASYHNLIQAQADRISDLEESNDYHERHIQKLISQLNEISVAHKREIYARDLELSEMRREREADENRIAALYDDMQDLAGLGNSSVSGRVVNTETSSATSGFVVELATKAKRYECAVEVMKNQVKMMELSSKDMADSYKNEIAELEYDRSKMEVDLLNQLASIDNERKKQSILHAQQQQSADDTIRRLQRKISEIQQQNDSLREKSRFHYVETSRLSPSRISSPESLSSPVMSSGTDGPVSGYASSSSYSSVDTVTDLQNEISRLREEKRHLEQERCDADTLIEAMESDIDFLKGKLSSVMDELDDANEKLDAVDGEDLEKIAKERGDIEAIVERVAEMWGRANKTLKEIEVATGLIPRAASPQDQIEGSLPMSSNSKTYFDTILELQNEIRVSLMLVELKLRNQLLSISNDERNTSIVWDAKDDAILQARIDAAQNAATAHMNQLEEKLLREMQQFDPEKSNEMKTALAQKTEELDSLRASYSKTEEQMKLLQSKYEGSSLEQNDAGSKTSVDEDIDDSEGKGATSSSSSDTVLVSAQLIEKLHDQVVATVSQMTQKNEIIKYMQAREEVLKRELKKTMRHAKNAEKGANAMSSPKKKSSRRSRNVESAPPGKPSSSLDMYIAKSTANARSKKMAAAVTAAKTAAAGAESKSPSRLITPLRPSNREICSRVAAAKVRSTARRSEKSASSENAMPPAAGEGL